MSKQHQTALVIDASNGFDGKFAERANRLIQSVNGPNIKADIYTFDGSKLVEGLPTAAKAATNASTIEEALSGFGYAQIVVAKPGI